MKKSSRRPISLTMIVRNEEENIADCLKCVRDLVDEVVVVDTGSEDRTKAIAADAGARVFDFPWVDSFARARNEAIRHATGEWIFWLDADDRVEGEDRERLRAVFRSVPENEIRAYSMKVECVSREGRSPTIVDHVRLFPRHSALRWEYRVHENILPAINRLGGAVAWTDVTIRHYGYLDEALRERKRRRDHALLQKSIEENPDDPFIHFNLGHSVMDGGDLAAAAFHLRESIHLSEPHYSQVKKAYVLRAQVERSRGDLQAALEVAAEGRKHYPKNAELLYFSGIYLSEAGDRETAAACFETILATTDWPKEFASYDTGILDHKTRHRLARLRIETGELAAAEALLRKALRADPEYYPAVGELARVLLLAGRPAEAEPLIERLRGANFLPDVLYLEGLRRETAGEAGEALRRYAETLEIDPLHEDCLAQLSGAPLAGGDLAGIERCLRESLQRNPRSSAAQRALARVLEETGRTGENIEEEPGFEGRPAPGENRSRGEAIRERSSAPPFRRSSRRAPDAPGERRSAASFGRK